MYLSAQNHKELKMKHLCLEKGTNDYSEGEAKGIIDSGKEERMADFARTPNYSYRIFLWP